MTRSKAFDFTCVGRLAAIDGRLATITIRLGEMPAQDIEWMVRKDFETTEIGAFVGCCGKVRNVEGQFCGVTDKIHRLGAPKRVSA